MLYNIMEYRATPRRKGVKSAESQAVVAFTGADREVAKRALEENQWIEELAVNKVLDSLDQS